MSALLAFVTLLVPLPVMCRAATFGTYNAHMSAIFLELRFTTFLIGKLFYEIW
jgi:hypothetical protein